MAGLASGTQNLRASDVSSPFVQFSLSPDEDPRVHNSPALNPLQNDPLNFLDVPPHGDFSRGGFMAFDGPENPLMARE